MKIPKEKKQRTIIKAVQSFDYFVSNIFSLSFEKFVDGEFITKTANFLQNHDWTMRVSGRDHFKSTSLYAYFMWDLLRFSDTEYDREYQYFSYQRDMAAYHIGNIKDLIKRNEYFKGMKDMKTQAEGVIKYSWDGYNFITLDPHGMTSFKRGLHCNGGIFVDDPFQDPADMLNPKVVLRINDVFKTQMLAIPNRGASFHVVGTPQTNDDFFFDDKLKKNFEIRILPAIKDERKKEALWPEWITYEELKKKEEMMGEKIFAKEYMCSPVYAENTFFTDKQMDKMMVDILNFPYSKKRDAKGKDIIGGWDLGKHRHPAHFTVFEIDGDKWKQIHNKFFDNVDYEEQLEYIYEAIDCLEIDWVYYDASRGELEVKEEKNELAKELEPVKFTLKKKRALATELDKKVTNGNIKLIADNRQRRSFLSVLNDLKAIETPEGHGDAFFSTCCAMEFELRPSVGIY